MKKKRILIAEDHTILREGLKALLSSHPNLEIAGEAEDGLAAVRLAAELLPDLILMDLSLPKMNGLEAIREIKKARLACRILVLTIYKAEEYILEVLAAGADGYILKEDSHEELIMAITSILGGKSYLSPAVSKKVIEGYVAAKRVVRTETPYDTLTQREREVLKMIAEGYKNKDIARVLFISPKTVEKHRANLMRKLDLHNASEVTAFAAKRGLIAG